MPRTPRLDIPEVPQHVIQRGNDRRPCFFSDAYRLLYLDRLHRHAQASGCALHAYVLMDNHVHLLVTPAERGAVSRMMQSLGREFVRIVNDATDRTGTLWEGRFKSCLVDSERYLLACHRYIELNPVRAGICTHPAHYRWSSYRRNGLGKPDELLSPHPVMLSLGGSIEERQGNYRSFVDSGIERDELAKIRGYANSQRALGSAEFQRRVETELGRPSTIQKRGRKPRPGATEPELMI